MAQANRSRPTFSPIPRPNSVNGLPFGAAPVVGSAEFRRRMQQVGETLRSQQVVAVYLVHGASNDLRTEYAESYAFCFESAMHAPGRPAVPVRLFHWSGETHHLGCADGAVRLIDELLSLRLPSPGRVLLWGHEHAGNVLALMSMLLNGPRRVRERVFRAAEIYYRWPLLGWVDIPVWNGVGQQLRSGQPLDGIALDCVTFGTPTRYRWAADGYSQRLHFLDAHSLPQSKASAEPAWSAWRVRLANRQLGGVLPRDRRSTAAASTVALPTKTPMVMVEYGSASLPANGREPAGSVYTRTDWLLFHAEETVRRLYSGRAAKVA